MTTPPAQQDAAQNQPPEWTGIRTIGHANRFSTWDSEFRYDGRIHVPMGVRIKEVRYSYRGDGKAEMRASEDKRGSGGTGQEYEVIDLTFLDEADALTFTLRGDLNVDSDPRPEYGKKYRIRVDVTLDNGDVRTANPEIEVLVPNWRRNDGPMVGRPFVRLPYDNHWGGSPNSQAGFGYVADNGRIPGDKFIVDLVNPRQGESGVEGNNSESVYYQLVHEDGTPSHYTSTPQRLHAEGHKDSGTGRKVTLPTIDLRAQGDKPGYYRFLVWPQSSNTDGSVSELSWDPAKPEDAFQLGSVYYRYNAPHSAAFTVHPGGPPDVELTPGGPTGYPGVRLQSSANGAIGPQNVRVSLPPDKGLEFVSQGNPGYQLTVQDAQGNTTTYRGELASDGQNLYFSNVNLALTGPGSKSTAWVAVRATETAPQGDSRLIFHVGGHTEESTPIHVRGQEPREIE